MILFRSSDARVIYRFKNCELSTDRILLKRDGKPVGIEPQVFDALLFLITRRGRVVLREELLSRVWGHEYVSESTLSSCIKLVRKSVGDDGTRQEIIRTVHGKGYEFVADVVEEEHAGRAVAADMPDGGDGSRHSLLPAPIHPLIGRRELIGQVRVELHTHRLITLVGPGGVGKTSIAYEVARAVEQQYGDGVWPVEMVTVLNPDAAVETIATALRVHPRQDGILEDAILDLLRNRECLLLLDNCEHLLEPLSGLVDRILRAAPRVRIMATSREPLSVSAERLWPVDPLPFAGDSGSEQSMEELADIPAIKLFVERAVAADPHFELNASTAPAVAEICRRLDGMPLAIELAAARARTIDIAEIAKRLDQRFHLLKGVRRDHDPRHRALHDTLRWSFELLGAEERKFFAELSIFSGRFDLDAAETICRTDAAADVMDLVTRLVEKSMVTVKRSEGYGLRYELLESLRAFGREQLDPHHSAGLSERHARYYIALAVSVEEGLQGGGEPHLMYAAEAAFPDLRAAHRHCLDQGDPAGALTLCCTIREYAMRSMRYEALAWAESAMLLDEAPQHYLYPTAMAIQAYGAWVRGEFEAALEYARRAMDLEHEMQVVPRGLAERVLANVLFVQGDTDGGIQAIVRQLGLAEESGNESRLVHACYMSSIASSSLGDFDAASRLAERARHYGRRTGSPTDMASAFVAIGFSSCNDPGAAMAAFTEADRIAGRAGNRWLRSFARTEICGLMVEQNDVDRARTALADVVDVWFRAGEWSQQWLTLTRCVVALFAMGEHELAARVIGAIEARAVLGALPVTVNLRDQALEIAGTLAAQFGTERYELLLKAGAEAPVSEVVYSVRAALRG